MNCKHVENNLKEYLSGSLDPVLNELITTHLADCEDCHKLLEQEKSLSDFLKQAHKSLSIPSISDDLMSKMQDFDRKLESEKESLPEQVSNWKVRWFLFSMVILGFIAIGLLVIPFHSKLDQQHIGSEGGPGYTWFGEFPNSDPDPFELNRLSMPSEMQSRNDDQDRIIHTLDFDDSPMSTDQGLDGEGDDQ